MSIGHPSAAIHADEPVAYLMALVVDETAPTATHREAAHKFYEHLGYVKTGYRYTRNLE